MTTMTLPSIQEDVARRVEIEEQIARLKGEMDMINDRLRVQPYGNHDAGDWQLQIQHNRRLDAERISQRFPVAQYPHLYKPTIDTAAVKENFAPIELEKFYIEGAAKVVVR